LYIAVFGNLKSDSVYKGGCARPAFDLRKELEVVALAVRNSSYIISLLVPVGGGYVNDNLKEY
jgi:hypothetical protein